MVRRWRRVSGRFVGYAGRERRLGQIGDGLDSASIRDQRQTALQLYGRTRRGGGGSQHFPTEATRTMLTLNFHNGLEVTKPMATEEIIAESSPPGRSHESGRAPESTLAFVYRLRADVRGGTMFGVLGSIQQEMGLSDVQLAC